MTMLQYLDFRSSSIGFCAASTAFIACNHREQITNKCTVFRKKIGFDALILIQY